MNRLVLRGLAGLDFFILADFAARDAQSQEKAAGNQAQNYRHLKLRYRKNAVLVRHYPQSEPDRYPAQYRENKFNERIHKIEL